MFVDVKAEKRQQTEECHPSSLLSAVQLNRVQRPSVAREKTCFNSSKGGLEDKFLLQEFIFEHNSSNGGRQW